MTSGSKVCSVTNMPGDKFVATLNEAVTGTNGAVIPAGSAVVLEVASVSPAANAEEAHVALRVRAVVVNDKTYMVDASVTPTTRALLPSAASTAPWTSTAGCARRRRGCAPAGSASMRDCRGDPWPHDWAQRKGNRHRCGSGRGRRCRGVAHRGQMAGLSSRRRIAAANAQRAARDIIVSRSARSVST